MSPITTHVLDTRLGQPARQLAITLSKQENSTWQELASGQPWLKKSARIVS